MIIRLLSIVAAVTLFVGCIEQPAPKKANVDVVGEFHKRYTAMCEAMAEGDIERAKQLSRDTNTWLESLSAEEQTLISRTLTHTEH